MTAICEISMSVYAVLSMYGKINLMFARKMHLAMLIFWAFAGSQLSKLPQKNKDKKLSVTPLIWLGAVVITGIILNYAIGDSTDNSGFDTSGWQTSVQTTTQNSQETVQNTTNNKESHLAENNGLQTVNDSFILINVSSMEKISQQDIKSPLAYQS